MQQVDPEAAFAEACQALGESIVRERFYVKIVEQQSETIKALSPADATEDVTDDPSDKSGGLQKDDGLSQQAGKS